MSVARWHSPSLVSALHRHALESVLGFFSLQELPRLMQVCNAFRFAIASMAPLHEIACLSPGLNLVPICKSPLLTHVGKLFADTINPHSLDLLSSSAVNLRSLICEPFYAGDPATIEWVLPPKITHLNVGFAAEIPVAVIDGVLAAAASLGALCELTLEAGPLERVNLQPLARLHSLHTLQLTDKANSQTLGASASLIPEQLNVIRALSHSLTSLQVMPALSSNSVQHLFAAGHSFRIKNLGRSLRLFLTSGLGELIASLPLEWTVLWPTDSLVFLPRLAPTMRNLHISLSVCTVEPDAIVSALGSLTGLTDLALGKGLLTSAHLATLMSALPQLRHLELNNMSELQSLAFLSVADAPKLESLSLSACSHRQFSPLELQHLQRAQTRLAFLSLTDTFNVPLDPYCRSLLNPPSVLLPSLESFDYGFADPAAEPMLAEYQDDDEEGDD